MSPWNHWYHMTGSTKGTWVRGDSRGWRARHHREHVNGDYKAPPPVGKYAKLEDLSKRLMQRKCVKLTPKQRAVARDAMMESLTRDGAEVLALCVGKKHWHALTRFEPTTSHRPDGWLFLQARRIMGRAKGRSARALSRCGELPEGGVWGVRCRPIPIKNRQHQVNVADYIPAHARKGAAVFSIPRMKKPRA